MVAGVMARWIFRVQAKDGRGPFRPGLSVQWSDAEGDNRLAPFYEEFGEAVITRAHELVETKGGACGCAVATRDMISKWFTATERRKLKKLGYRVVTMSADEILAESENQIVFWRKRPLRLDCLIIPWGDI